MLRASRCKNNHTFLPIKKMCPKCRCSTVQVDISAKGKVESYSILTVPPEGFESPLLLALVKMDEGGMVFCKRKIKPPEDSQSPVRIGSEVRIYQEDNLLFFAEI